MPDNPHFDGPRLIRPEDWSAARHLDRICFGGLPVTAQEDPLPPDYEAEETYLIADQGRPVSKISIFYTPLRVYDGLVRVGSIGGVCTHPDYRGHNLASQLMNYCAHQLAQGGAGLMLISGERGLYRRLGNVCTGKYAGFLLRPGQLSPAPDNIRLRKAEPSDAALCGRLYQGDPTHFTRGAAVFQQAFRPHPLGFHAEEWLVEMDGQPAAYVLLSIPWDYAGQPEAGVRRVHEYAGSRVALAGAFAAALAQPGIRELQAPIPWQDMDLIHLLSQGGDVPEWIHLPEHTMRIINFPGLMNGLLPYVRAVLPANLHRGLRFEQAGPLQAGEGEGKCSISRGRDRLTLTTAEMTTLVMGDPYSILRNIAAPGALAEIIAALFPLPSFFPGLDYH